MNMRALEGIIRSTLEMGWDSRDMGIDKARMVEELMPKVRTLLVNAAADESDRP